MCFLGVTLEQKHKQKRARTNLKRRSICLCNWTNLKLYIVYTYITSLQILIYLYIPFRIVHGYVWFIVHVILCKSSFLQPCNRCFKHNIIFFVPSDIFQWLRHYFKRKFSIFVWTINPEILRRFIAKLFRSNIIFLLVGLYCLLLFLKEALKATWHDIHEYIKSS